MKIQQLIYALEITKTGSMNQAAINLHITQPTISVALQELESTIGFPIFERTNKGMNTTSKGLEFLLNSEPLINNYFTLRDKYVYTDKPSTYSLSISSQHYNFIVGAFIKLIHDNSQYDYSFSLKETQTLNTIIDVATAKSEIGFIFKSRENFHLINRLLNEKNIEFHPMAKIDPCVFINENHPLSKKDKISIMDLKPYPMIIYKQEGSDLLSEEYIRIPNHNQIIFTKDRGTTNNLISQTNGFNIGTGIIVDKVEPNNIVSIPLSDANGYMEVGWLKLITKDISSLAINFIELAYKELNHKYDNV